MASGLFVQPNYKNKRVPFTKIYGTENASLIAAWRGVKNSARIVFVGNCSLVEMINSEDKD